MEAYYSLIIQYATKNTSFSDHGMISRLFIIKVTPHKVCFSSLTLAAMHYNHNSGRKQAVMEGGKKRFSVLFPKYKKGGNIVRQIKTRSNYGESPLSHTVTSICILIEFLNPIIEETFRLVKTPARNTTGTESSTTISQFTV